MTHTSRSEGVRTARAAIATGASILVGAACASVVRIVLPRVLGPETYGPYRLAESLAEILLVVLSLGLDTTLRRDVARAPDRAGARLWDVVALRARAATVLGAVAITALASARVATATLVLFATFAVAQGLVALSNAHVAVLQALGDSRRPALVGVLVRAGWSIAALALLIVAPQPLPVAVALVVAEGARWGWLDRQSRARHGAPPRGRGLPLSAWGAAVASLPVFVNLVAHNLYARVGTWGLAGWASAAEVGWHGAAANVAGIALLAMPLVTWVLLPSASRAGAESAQVRDAVLGGALRAALLLALPGALLLAWGAGPLVGLLYGPAFAPAADVLRLLAPTVGLAYLSTIAAVALLERDGERTVATVSVGGLVLCSALTAFWVRTTTATGAAAGAARATLVTEIVVTAVLLALAWRPAWTPPLVRTIGGLALAAVIPLLLGPVLRAALLPVGPRFALLATAALASLFLTRAVDRADLAFARDVLRRPTHA